MEGKGTSLRLYDVVGERIPPLREILPRLGRRITDVTICFTPDRLDVEAEVVPSDWPDDIAMARGPYIAEGTPFIVPRTAHH